MGSVFEDFINSKLTEYNASQLKTRKGERAWVNKKSKFRADVAIKLCTKCNRTWEREITKNNIIRHPKGMIPTYGKKRQDCGTC